MLNAKMKSAMLAGKAALIATLLGSAAYAQVSVDTPAGNNVVVPETALEGQAPVATTSETGYETLAQNANDEAIRNALESQGFTNILITRDGTTLTVTANRGDEMVELVYSTATGRLIAVDGVPVGPDEADFVVIDDPAAMPTQTDQPMDTVGRGGTTQPGLPGETDGGEPVTMPGEDATPALPDAVQPGIPGETEGGEPDATIGTDASDPGAAGGEDAADVEGVADTDGQG